MTTPVDQSIVVSVHPTPIPQTTHMITIPAPLAEANMVKVVDLIETKEALASVPEGHAPFVISLQRKQDGSWGGQIVFKPIGK